MAFRIIVLTCFLAYARAAIGASHQSVERSLGGAQSISHYSKAVDSAFSSVRKYDTRITNDALTLGIAHAPIATYQAPLVTKAVAPALAYSAAPAVSSSYLHRAQPIALAAPQPLNYAPSATVVTKAVATPLIQSYHAPIVTKTVAPVVRSFAPSLLQSYSSPLVTKAVAEPLTVSAGPVVTKAAVAYSPATVVAHTTFTGLGTAYEW
ncbi:cuticle protein LPCP-23-like [Diorhabda carinulata]|uniref:cuticle protein LPCP-23-like n=1 Tax=Diorhabda carinulata TaxID=1163345 RepID=UPI0025A13EE0|nr:cuticle protein LPCP-23-like [Diorhabda carinulata]